MTATAQLKVRPVIKAFTASRVAAKIGEDIDFNFTVLGADEITTFWKVTVPQLWPGILSGALLGFIVPLAAAVWLRVIVVKSE